MPKRPGFYVDGKFFGDRFHQARARAAYLAGLYGRGVDIEAVPVIAGNTALYTVATVYNGKPRRAAA